MSLNKPSASFWVIAAVALIWNLFGVFQLLGMTVLKDAVLAEMPTESAAIVLGLPAWYNYVFALAVFPAVLASLLLLLRRRLAIPLFGLSLLALLVQFGYWIFGTSVMEVEGAQAIIMPIIVIGVGVFLYYYSKGAAQKGWLR
jgi:hypothetical protein